MAKRKSVDIKNKTSRSKKTAKRLAVKKEMLKSKKEKRHKTGPKGAAKQARPTKKIV
mgnify:CR=1 FL=1